MAGPSEINIGGVNLLATALKTVFSDVTDTLKENVTFHSATRSPQATWLQLQTFGEFEVGITYTIDWATYFSVHLGLREAASGNWEIFLYPIMGSHEDPLERPFYTRLTITAEFVDAFGNTANVDLDVAATADVIGHNQGIPCTVVVWNPTTGMFVSAVEGHTLAFIETKRIHSDPNETGFAQDGVFVIRYDHTVENEDRAEFYVAACWPGHFVDSAGKFLRGDVPDLGQTKGFSHGEDGPYVHRDDRNATNYPITHLVDPKEAYVDSDAWDNNWDRFGSPQRHDSGIGPFCGNIVSRGADYLRDFGMAWLVKDLAARTLTQLPSPVPPQTTRAEFLYNYDADAMRAKGRVMWSLAVLARALTLLETVRDTAVDTEVAELKLAVFTRAGDIITLLKLDYDNDSWLETFEGLKIQIWELGHYWQGMLVYQEAVFALLGVVGTKVHQMMVTFAEKLHLETLLWVNNGPHPRDATVTYTGGHNGWRLEDQIFLPPLNPAGSHDTSVSDKLVAVYEWAKQNGIDQGAKQDAIIAQYAGSNYKWHYAGGAEPPDVFAQVAFALELGFDTGTPKDELHASVEFALQLGLVATPTISGGSLFRTGTPIPWDAKPVGDPILVGPGINEMGTKNFSVVRGDHFKQPFTVSLESPRVLDGSESWSFSIRKTKDTVLLLTLISPVQIEVDGSFQPSVVFLPETVAPLQTEPGADEDFIYDLQMKKGGKVETYAIDNFTLIGDVTRT